MILLATVCTGYSWHVRDRSNYTDIISGFVAVLFWLVGGTAFFSGIVADSMTYASEYIAWIFIGIAIIQALIVFIRVTELWGEH
ncbi:hypothetical protein [Methanococcoides sp. FTZ1]|uniref:hypothetical protein n=1 Tax=Methanococcoides sp. FTZ1 TaxID=3439061 RepID=UPI003F86A0E7